MKLLLAGLLFPISTHAGNTFFDVKLADPLHPSRPQRVYPLSQIVDENGFPKEYTLSLNLDVCLDQVCNRIDVNLIWDALGRYLRMEMPIGTALEKRDHVPFDQQDCIRMDEILGDAGSILGTFPPEDFLEPSGSNPEKVDGVSAATPLALRNAVIDGAAHTTWVLWHWVNGDIVNELRALTTACASSGYLKNGLQSADDDLVQFALRNILENQVQDSGFRDDCFRILEMGPRQNSRLALRYLAERSPDREELHRRLVGLIGANSGSNRLILEYFDTQAEWSPALREAMAGRLGTLSSYDLYAVLNLLEKHGGDTGPVRAQVSRLLASDNAYVVRCAQDFLDGADEQEGLENQHGN